VAMLDALSSVAEVMVSAFGGAVIGDASTAGVVADGSVSAVAVFVDVDAVVDELSGLILLSFTSTVGLPCRARPMLAA